MVGSAGATIMLSSWANSIAMISPLIAVTIWRGVSSTPGWALRSAMEGASPETAHWSLQPYRGRAVMSARPPTTRGSTTRGLAPLEPYPQPGIQEVAVQVRARAVAGLVLLERGERVDGRQGEGGV